VSIARSKRKAVKKRQSKRKSQRQSEVDPIAWTKFGQFLDGVTG
jgi:hypothetical protein